MLETQFQTLFGIWLSFNKPLHSQNYELKVTDDGTFNLKEWRNKQPHQPRSLKQANSDTGIFHKISDMSMGQKPFDSFFIRNTESLLVIYFNKYSEFFIIPIKEVPEIDSLSYFFCMKHFKPQKLLKKIDKKIIDF